METTDQPSLAHLKGRIVAHEQAKAQMRHLCTAGLKVLAESGGSVDVGTTATPVRISVIGAGEALNLIYGERLIVFAMNLAGTNAAPRTLIHVSVSRNIGLPEPVVSRLGDFYLDTMDRASAGNLAWDTTDPEQLHGLFLHFLVQSLAV